MEQYLNDLSKTQVNVHSLRKACKLNSIGINFLFGFKIEKMRDIYHRLLKQYSIFKSQLQKQSLERKGFLVLKRIKAFSLDFNLIQFDHQQNDREFCIINNLFQKQQDWNFFKKIFFVKEFYTFKYQSKKILNKNVKTQHHWNNQENQMFLKIMLDPSMKNRWSEVARLLYQLSDHNFFRTGKQCREHWINHLDLSKIHGKWSIQEDLIILKYVINEGRKWSNISKEELPHRTEHMIKNRFKSLLISFNKAMGRCRKNKNQARNIKSLIKKLQRENNKSKICLEEIKQEKIDIYIDNSFSPALQGQDKIQKQIQLNNIQNEKIIPQSQKTSNNLLIEDSFKIEENLNAASNYYANPMSFLMLYSPSCVFLPYANYWNCCSNPACTHSAQSQ